MSPGRLVGTLLRETFAPTYKAPVIPRSWPPMEPPRRRVLSPPAPLLPLEDTVPCLTARAHALVGSISPNKYPTGHLDQKEKGAYSTFGNELPDKEGLTLLDPTPYSPYPSARGLMAPTRLPTPEPLRLLSLPSLLLRTLLACFSKFLGKGCCNDHRHPLLFPRQVGLRLP